MHYRLIALDLNGTLLNRRGELTPRTRMALAAARGRGVITAVATGRLPHSAMHWSRKIGGGPVLACNGAALFGQQGELLHHKGIPSEWSFTCWT